MNTIFKKVLTGTAVLALSTTVFTSTSLAATSGTDITGGPLAMDAVTSTAFENKTLDGTTVSVVAQINPFNITDARGSGAGWHVNVSASQFAQAAGLHPLATGALDLAVPVVTKNDVNSSNTSTITPLGGKIDAGIIKLLSAETNGGMGSYQVAAIPMTLTLKPNEVYEGTYTSTITVTLTTGP